MEEKKTIFDYIGMVFITFGFSILILNILCLLFGEETKGFSSIFSLGKEGLSVATMMQYLAVSVLIVLVRVLFMTDMIIKKMPGVVRIFCMIVSAVGIVALFILRFRWFPADEWLPWIMFFVSFGICFVVSMSVTILKERAENRKMEEALARLKQQG